MTKKRFQGTGTAMVTPFNRDGSIDEAATRNFVEFQIREGVDMLFPCGTTGEGSTLEPEESERVLSIVVDQAQGRVPVIVGAGANSTARAVRATERAAKLGADGVLSVGPFYNKPTQGGFYEHYKAIAAVGIPVVVYNIPSRTGSNIEAATMLRIAELPNVVGVKEASANFTQIMEILRSRPADFRVLSGEDSLTVPILALGGDGIVAVISNEAPALTRGMVDAGLAGDFERARSIHYKLLPLMGANFVETNPIPVKAVLSMMGMLEENYRLPLMPIAAANRTRLRKVAEELGILQSVETQA